MSGVVLEDVTKIYPDSGHPAVDGISLRVADGELFVLLGPSGCGKTTILRMIAGLEPVTTGVIKMGDTVVNDLEPRERGVAMVFQSGGLYPHRTVEENIMFPLQVARESPEAIKEKLRGISRTLGIADTLDRLPRTLSGGQRQRVAMGRALVREPALFLMDEPLSDLDTGMRTELRLEIAGLIRSLGVTALYVTHDQNEALALADRIGIMSNGTVQDVGTPQQIYNDPATAFSAAFLSQQQLNLVTATVEVIPGEGFTLDFGDTRFPVHWGDRRAAWLGSLHGNQVLLGFRPDALSPTDPDHATFSGCLRALEYQGHEWIAFVEAGLPGLAVPEPGRQAPRETAGSHRRGDLVIRMSSARGWVAGQPVHLALDFDQVLLFDDQGQRVDPPHR